MNKNVLKIFKKKKELFSSDKKTIQAAKVGTELLTAAGGNTTTKNIPHQYDFIPFCIVYAITDLLADGKERGVECPFPSAAVPDEFYDFDTNTENLILKLTSTLTRTRKFKYYIFADKLEE